MWVFVNKYRTRTRCTLQVDIKSTSRTAKAKSISSRATSVASIGTTRVRWNWVKGQSVRRMRRVIEKMRSIEAVFMEEILADVASMEIRLIVIWLLTGIANESFIFRWIHNWFQNVGMAKVLFTFRCCICALILSSH